MDLSLLPPAATHTIDFDREIWPILEENCLKCHGPEIQRNSLRFDIRKRALKGGDTFGPDIIPGKSTESPLIHFIAGLDPERVMPAEGDRLTDTQIGIMRAWIDQGAHWPDTERFAGELDEWKNHWAFRPLRQPPVPDSVEENPSSSAVVDTFIRQKLTEQGLEMSPRSDRRTLIRRLSFDLIGLPPTPAEMEAFEADPDPQAYQNLVDRLLASPRYGERWARHWLDVVRFAESDGFEHNKLRLDAYPYRDYVIQAFNDDLPYNRFVREQLAGDALGADAATGFIVGGSFDFLQSFEPPVFNAGQRQDELADIVAVTGSTYLGLTLDCARCHDHKFDPVSQADYFAMTAIFNGVEHGSRPLRPNATMFEKLMAKASGPQQRIAEIDRALAPFRPIARKQAIRILAPDMAEGERIAYSAGTEPGQAGDPGNELRLPTLSPEFSLWTDPTSTNDELRPWDALPAGRFRIWVSWGVAAERTPAARYLIAPKDNSRAVADRREIAQVNQTLFADGRPAVANESRWSGFHDAGIHDLAQGSQLVLTSGVPMAALSADVVVLEEIPPGENPPRTTAPHIRAPVVVKANEDRFAPVDAKFLRFTVLESNTPEGYLDELEVFTAEKEPRNVALKEFGAEATSPLVDGLDGNPFYANDRRYNERAAWSSPMNQPGYLQIKFSQPERIDRILWSRNRSTRAPDLDDHLVTAYHVEVSLDGEHWTWVASSADRLPPDFRPQVPAIPTLSRVPLQQSDEVAALVAERTPLRAEIAPLTEFPPVYAGAMREPGPTFRLHRGNPMQPKEQVSPSAPANFGYPMVLPPDTPEQQRRLALADWIVDPANPLPARVMVNRLWHYHFGTGIVGTPSDFGINGARPSHPELLDWLASEFIARDWSIKSMHRLIVNSETYRQSSRPNPAGLKLDAAARYLWRFPPRRMEAEALRDTILAMSDDLNLNMGGPGFFMFDSEVSRSGIQLYDSKSEFSENDFRRMVYQLKPRAQLDDVFGAFDCPDAGQIAPNRTRSTTPLQAFNLLNSPFILQQARTWAARLEEDAGDDPDGQVRRAFQLAFGRDPAAVERDASVAMVEQHGLPLLCRALFNTIEFITID